ncbi:MAG: serine/threonine-protein kinase [Pirellulales bacterium]
MIEPTRNEVQTAIPHERWFDEACDRFEAAWKSGSNPRIEEYLDQVASVQPSQLRALLHELILIDLEYRWLNGDRRSAIAAKDDQSPARTDASPAPTLPARPLLEDYARRYAELGPSSDLPLRLIQQEYRLRRLHGAQPSPGEYAERFPGREEVVHALQVLDSIAGKPPPELLRPKDSHGRNPVAAMTTNKDKGGSDRNLLVGILAVQMDFVRREQLMAAMNAWLLEKKTPLEDILLRQGALDDETRKLLVALVAKHLALHQNDAEKSLQAVGALGTLHGELQSLADPQIENSLLRFNTGPADPFVTQTTGIGASTSLGQRFRILRPHAKGGLGQVSVALDTELHREVALKEIQPPHADYPQSRARFTLEAEITGGLEHPGVVPIYGLGTYSDGRPYYAMRFIHGDSLREALDRYHRNDQASAPGAPLLELRKLLGRFIDVCNAIEYAHSRGVLHRDLKPGNIMLGKYGETLVVDWGLAKPIGSPGTHGHTDLDGAPNLSDEPLLVPSSISGTAPTQMGSALGTPAYMSPEQAAGRLDQLGPASDIYSLGATLYHVLTGQAPVPSDSDLGEQLRKVQRGDFPRPRSLKKDLPKPLEAICLKAMALKPENRYASAVALANDVEHWMADEPTAALPDGLAQRGLRWLRHNWVAAFAATAAILVVAVVSIAAGFVLNAQKQEILIARNAAEALANEKDELATAERKAKQQAREAIDNYVLAVQSDELLKDERFQPLRKKLLQDARAFYEAFIEDFHPSLHDQQHLAEAFLMVGNISSSSGSAGEAANAYRAALELRKDLAQEKPSHTPSQTDLAGGHNILGVLEQRHGRYEDAHRSYRAALSIQQKLTAEKPEDHELHGHLAATHVNLGTLHKETRALDEALKAFRAALATYEKLAKANPVASHYQSHLAKTHNNLAEVYKEQGALDEALKSYRAALAIQETLAQSSSPTNSQSNEEQSLLATIYSNLGGLHYRREERGEALKSYRAALEIQEKLARENPLLAAYQNNLAKTYNNLGVLRRDDGAPIEALKSYRAALEIRQKLAPEKALDASFQEDLARNHLNIAELRQVAGSAASQSLTEAETILKSLKERFPKEPRYEELLTRCAKLRE